MLGVCSVLVVLTTAWAAPVSQDVSFIADSTIDLANILVKDSKYANQVFSPLGYNTLLAIFAEGARGDTKAELAKVLHYPESQEAVRLGYQNVLRHLSDKYKTNHPEMKNWFYIYKNFTYNEEVAKVLREFYFTEVREVNRPYNVFSTEREEGLSKVKIPSGLQGKPTDHLIKPDEDVVSVIETSNNPHKSDGEEASSDKEKEENDALKVVEAKPEIADKKDEEKVNEEPLVAEVVKNEPSVSESLPGAINNAEKVQLSQDDLKKNDELLEEVKTKSEKNSAIGPVEPLPESETMVAMQRDIKNEKDLKSSIEGGIKLKNRDLDRALAFNGLFFKGDWSEQFVQRPADKSRPFHTLTEEIIVPTIHAEGLFRTADIPEINSRAIELKYGEGRYTLLLVVPKEVSGLSKLDVDALSLNKINERLSEKMVDVCLPTFEITTISKSPLSRMKMDRLQIFDPELADLSGLSSEPNLHLDGLEQVVTLIVEAKYTETVLLTAAMASSRSDIEKFEVNRPFLFYVRDNIDNLVIINGKLVDPSVKMELPDKL